ncbi:hypothetical protein FRB95_013235 [Tulasnella sp. JGI-2019a]|nr:hypothetical protein FRB95_013235 [Tulasnella sp. JGI-2019a]
MQTGSAPSHPTLLPNFNLDQTLWSLPPAPTASRLGARIARCDHTKYIEQASTQDSGQAELGGASLTTLQSGVIRSTEDAASDTPQLLIGDRAKREVNTGPVPRTVIACVPCRSRKVRCDGARPSCSNCRKRHSAASCTYAMAPGRRGPDKKPGRIRGPSRSSASIEKKKQIRVEVHRDNATRTQKASTSNSVTAPRQPPKVEVDSYPNSNLPSAPTKQNMPATPPFPVQIRESNVSIHPTTVPVYSAPNVISLPVTQAFTPPTLNSDGLIQNADCVPTHNQARRYPVNKHREALGAPPSNNVTTTLSEDYARYSASSTFGVQNDAHWRSRPSLDDILIPDPSPGLILPSSSSSSQIPPSSTQSNDGYSAYSSYQHGLGLQSVYAPTPNTTEPTTAGWAPASLSSSYAQTFTTERSNFGKEQHWHVSDQSEDTATYGQQVATYDLQVWDPQEQAGVVNNHDVSYLQHGRAPQHRNVNTIVREPSLHFSCETWWDTVLYIYGTDETSSSLLSDSLQPLSWHGSRHDAAVEISNDVYSFFKVASNWLSFINVPLFLSQFHHAEYRMTMQPALVLGILAYFKLLQTSQEAQVNGEEGSAAAQDETEKAWRKSVMLRDLAQAAFDASYNAGWIDTPLAQAAWIFTLYEISAHRDTTSHRMESSMIILDNVIHVLGLRTLDRTNPRVPIMKAGAVPAFGRPRPNGPRHKYLLHSKDLASQGHAQVSLKSIEPPQPSIQYQATPQQTPFDLYRSANNSMQALQVGMKTKGCPCHALSLAGSSEAQISTPLWLCTPKWTPDASWAEMRKEEARRLVWSSVTVLSSDAAARLAMGRPQLDLHAAKPENYALLLPGEELYATRPEVDTSFSGKESTWALYGRTMLLWYACVSQIAAIKMAAPISFFNGNMNGGLSFTPEQLAVAGPDHVDFALRAWMETLAIEESLNEHTCDGEKATLYQAREYLFTIRMFITGGFQQYIPYPQSGVDFSRLDRDQAIHWLHHQNNVATQLQMVINAKHSPARHLLVKRPYVMWWQMNLIGRALQLWAMDHSLVFAVDVALNIYPVLKWFERVWPCPEQQRRVGIIMDSLTHICRLLGKQIPV